MELAITLEPPVKELVKYIETRRWMERPVQDFFKRAGEKTVLVARAGAPRDRGLLGRAIEYKVERSKIPMWVKIGIFNRPSMVPQAAAMEYGTGRFVGKPPYFPPPQALEGWARRHGFPSGYMAARAIFLNGGLKPRRYLRKGMDAYAKSLPSEIKRMERKMQQEFDFG